MTHLAPQEATQLLAALPKRRFAANWPSAREHAVDLLVPGFGDGVDEVAGGVVQDMIGASSELRFERAAEMPDRPQMERTLRLRDTKARGGQAACAVAMRAKGRDLHLRLHGEGHSRIRIMHRLFHLALFISLWAITSAVFWVSTDVQASLVQEYARKWAPDASAAGMAAREGWAIDPETGDLVPVDPPTIGEMMRRDPILFALHVGRVPAILGIVVGVLLWFLPAGVFDRVMRWCGQEPAELFDDRIRAHCAWVESMVCRTLDERFGVQESDLHRLQRSA